MQPFFGQLDKYFQPKLLYMLSIAIFEGKIFKRLCQEYELTRMKLAQRSVLELEAPTSSSAAAQPPDLGQLAFIKALLQSSTL